MIRLADRTIEVFQLSIRPKDDGQPRAVGAVFVERGTAQVVRMAFSFTRVALKDKSLEDVSVILENGLIEDRYWLPRRQQIEIRRTGTWLDFPFRGIIRGRWEIRDYDVNTGLPGIASAAPEIVMAPPDARPAFPFTGELLDGLPADVRTVTDGDVRAVQDAARELVRAQALQRTRGTSLRHAALSDFVRVNRVEGLALGAGLTPAARRSAVRVGATARSPPRIASCAAAPCVAWERAVGRRCRRSASSGILVRSAWCRKGRCCANSLASQEFGSRLDQPVPAPACVPSCRPAAVRAERLARGFEMAVERHFASAVHGTPARGRYEPTPWCDARTSARASLLVRSPTSLGWLGTEVATTISADAIRSRDTRRTLGRMTLDLDVQRPVGRDRLVLRTIAAGAVGRDIPLQFQTWFGGPVTLPGVDFHSVRARAGVSQRVEWQHAVPGPSIPLGRYGRMPGQLTLAPFAVLVWSDPVPVFTPAAAPSPAPNRFQPPSASRRSAIFDLLRVDVARGLRDGRWMFSVDLSRDFWRVL